MSKADAKKFDKWVGTYRKTLHGIADKDCYPNYTSVHWPEHKSSLNGITECEDCRNMASCLLKNLDDFDKADMQSAAVLLGLMPTFLQYISPNLGELDFVLRRRPLLAFLMVIGSPVISVRSRLFESTGMGENLHHSRT